jgi:hypothetical protein
MNLSDDIAVIKFLRKNIKSEWSAHSKREVGENSEPTKVFEIVSCGPYEKKISGRSKKMKY